MKKLIAFLLVFVMVISLCACGGNGVEETQEETKGSYEYNLDQETFSVGYSRIDITPESAVPMAGYGNTSKRMSQNIHDYLYATSVAINDGQGDTVVFLSLDLQRSSDIIVSSLRPVLSLATGLPEEAFHFTATHTHSGPDVQSGSEAIEPYNTMLFSRLTQVVMESLEDLTPATVSAGSIEAEQLNFVRHYYHLDENGEVFHFDDARKGTVIQGVSQHTSDADPTMFVLKFDREDAKDVCMINWRAHPHWTGGSSKYNISSDYVGPFREAFEMQTDCLFAYYQGAAGNINEKSRITSENLAVDYREHGARLANYAIKCINESMEPIDAGKIQIKSQTLTLKVNKTDDVGFLNAAKTWQTVYNVTKDTQLADESIQGYKIYSTHHANSVVANYSKADTENRTYSVVTIGKDLAISLAPHEMFDSNMQALENDSQFKYTLHFSYSNGTNTYMPDAFTWSFGSYETDTALFVPGSAELVQQTFTDMIADMYASAQ